MFVHIQIHVYIDYVGPVRTAVFSGDGSLVLTASGDRTAKIWDASTGDCTKTLSGHISSVISAAFAAE